MGKYELKMIFLMNRLFIFNINYIYKCLSEGCKVLIIIFLLNKVVYIYYINIDVKVKDRIIIFLLDKVVYINYINIDVKVKV